MTIYVPWGLIAVAIVLYFTLSANKKSRLIKKERAESLKNVRQEYLQSILRDDKVDNTTIKVEDE